MKQKWKDWFTEECNTCGGSMKTEGMVYVIRNVHALCHECYDSIKIYLIDMDIKEIHESACMCLDCMENFTPTTEPDEEDWQMKMIEKNQCPCCSKQLTEGCCIECGEVYE